MPKNYLYILAGIIIVNLFTSCLVVYSESSSISSITLDPCYGNGCISLSAFSSIPADPTTPPLFFIGNAEQNIYLRTNYNSPLDPQKIVVSDARDINMSLLPVDRDLSFTLQANISDLSSSTTVNSHLPMDKIGILTYNEASDRSLDGTKLVGGELPQSLIDPAYASIYHPIVSTAEPFDENRFDTEKTNNANFNEYFTFFPPPADPASATSLPINIITTAPSPVGYFGQYSFGLGMVFSFPSDSVSAYTLTDGEYSTTLTFTLFPN